MLKSLSHQQATTTFPWGKASILLLELVLVAILLRAYEVEPTMQIDRIFLVVLAGAFLQFLVPDAYRLHFFVLMGLVGVFALLPLPGVLSFLALFGLFFGISQLRLSPKTRGYLAILAGAGLAGVWAYAPGWIPHANVVVPIIGAIFMFRLSVYLYDVQYEKAPAPFMQRLAYFLMLPNLVFTLFPVVDYKVFRQSEDYSQRLLVQQKGAHWIIRGLVHLLLYRLIYYYFIPNPTKIFDLATLATYALCNYLLILRLSGLFHFAAGCLCLFGFDLPQVFNNYFLASGFSDLWRRINTYWRDYVMKIFYYPIYFKFKKMGQLKGMIITILIAFFITWLLHSYQWFWLKGSFPIRAVDAIFWGIFGVAVAGSAALQYYKKKKKIKPPKRAALHQSFVNVLQIAGMFTFMCLLWTFWNSPTVGEWWSLMGVARAASLLEWTKLLTVIVLLISVGTLLYYWLDRPKAQAVVNPDEKGPYSSAYSLLSLFPFLLLWWQPDTGQLLEPVLSKPSSHFLENRLNEQDDELMITGYYEDILVSNNLNSQVIVTEHQEVEGEDAATAFPYSELATRRNDALRYAIKPETQIIFKNAVTTSNSWGFRDQEYLLPKPANTLRIGIFGGSYVMGSGVPDEAVFNRIVNEHFANQPLNGVQIELVNMGTPGYHLLQNLLTMHWMGVDKELDIIAFVSHGVDENRSIKSLKRMMKATSKKGIPPFLTSLFAEHPDLLDTDFKSYYRQHPELSRQILEQAFESMNDLCTQNGIRPMFIYWPRTGVNQPNPMPVELQNQLNALNFLNIDLTGVYQGHNKMDIVLTERDFHPNERGHRLVAERLIELLTENNVLNEMTQSIANSTAQ